MYFSILVAILATASAFSQRYLSNADSFALSLFLAAVAFVPFFLEGLSLYYESRFNKSSFRKILYAKFADEILGENSKTLQFAHYFDLQYGVLNESNYPSNLKRRVFLRLISLIGPAMFCDPFSFKVVYERSSYVLTKTSKTYFSAPIKILNYENDQTYKIREFDVKICLGEKENEINVFYIHKKWKFIIPLVGDLHSFSKLCTVFKLLEEDSHFVHDDFDYCDMNMSLHYFSLKEIIEACMDKNTIIYKTKMERFSVGHLKPDKKTYEKLLMHNSAFWGKLKENHLSNLLIKEKYKKKPIEEKNVKWKNYVSDVAQFLFKEYRFPIKNYTKMKKSVHYDLLEKDSIGEIVMDDFFEKKISPDIKLEPYDEFLDCNIKIFDHFENVEKIETVFVPINLEVENYTLNLNSKGFESVNSNKNFENVCNEILMNLKDEFKDAKNVDLFDINQTGKSGRKISNSTKKTFKEVLLEKLKFEDLRNIKRGKSIEVNLKETKIEKLRDLLNGNNEEKSLYNQEIKVEKSEKVFKCKMKKIKSSNFSLITKNTYSVFEDGSFEEDKLHDHCITDSFTKKKIKNRKSPQEFFLKKRKIISENIKNKVEKLWEDGEVDFSDLMRDSDDENEIVVESLPQFYSCKKYCEMMAKEIKIKIKEDVKSEKYCFKNKQTIDKISVKCGLGKGLVKSIMNYVFLLEGLNMPSLKKKVLNYEPRSSLSAKAQGKIFENYKNKFKSNKKHFKKNEKKYRSSNNKKISKSELDYSKVLNIFTLRENDSKMTKTEDPILLEDRRTEKMKKVEKNDDDEPNSSNSDKIYDILFSRMVKNNKDENNVKKTERIKRSQSNKAFEIGKQNDEINKSDSDEEISSLFDL